MVGWPATCSSMELYSLVCEVLLIVKAVLFRGLG